MTPPPLLRTQMPGLLHRGKVRDLYPCDDRLMVVATDRISAFDVVMDQPVPGKGVLLTQMSRFWLDTLPACRPHHLDFVVSDDNCPPQYAAYVDQLRGRAMVVRRVAILPIECVVRGHLAGSGWKDYQATGRVSGVALPPGLRKADRLPEPIFTPSTKAAVGHDEPVSFDQAVAIVAEFLQASRTEPERKRGVRSEIQNPESRIQNLDARALMAQARDRSLAIYTQAAAHAEARGIILADTKFEFGLDGGDLLLADEVLTPDSSRFWPRAAHRPGQDPPSFDKQFLRDYLESIPWNKQPPPPRIPDPVLAQTRAKYEEACRLLTGPA